MRYYSIELYKADTTTLVRQYTSHPTINGMAQHDPGALNIVLDAYVYDAAAPIGMPTIKIWGVPISDVMQASDFNLCDVKVYAGFKKGLPLNNPAQSGLLFSGYVYQAFANWQGVEQTLDFVLAYKGAVASQKSNLSFSWMAGMPLAQALETTLTDAFPGVKHTINVSSKLVAGHDISGHYPSLVALGQMLTEVTQEILGGSYPGVIIVQTSDGISVQDGGVSPGAKASIPTYTYGGVSYPVINGMITVPSAVFQDNGFTGTASGAFEGATTNRDGTVTLSGVTPNGSQMTSGPATQMTDAPQPAAIQLAFQDFVGQPTWLDFGTIQFATLMRVDLSVGSVVTMPKGILGNPANPAGAPGAVFTTSASQPQARQASLFSGTYRIKRAHHMGEFRSSDGQAWISVFDANPTSITTAKAA